MTNNVHIKNLTISNFLNHKHIDKFHYKKHTISELMGVLARMQDPTATRALRLLNKSILGVGPKTIEKLEEAMNILYRS